MRFSTERAKAVEEYEGTQYGPEDYGECRYDGCDGVTRPLRAVRFLESAPAEMVCRACGRLQD